MNLKEWQAKPVWEIYEASLMQRGWGSAVTGDGCYLIMSCYLDFFPLSRSKEDSAPRWGVRLNPENGSDMTTETGWKTIRAMEEEAAMTTAQVHAGIKDGTFEATPRVEADHGDPMVRWAFPKA